MLTDFVTTDRLEGPVQTFARAAAESPVFAFIGGDFDHSQSFDLLGKRLMFKALYDANTPYMGDFVNLILRKTPIMHQWDDHDSGLNNIDKTYPDWNLAQQVFQEYVPSYPLPSVTPGIWQNSVMLRPTVLCSTVAASEIPTPIPTPLIRACSMGTISVLPENYNG